MYTLRSLGKGGGEGGGGGSSKNLIVTIIIIVRVCAKYYCKIKTKILYSIWKPACTKYTYISVHSCHSNSGI